MTLLPLRDEGHISAAQLLGAALEFRLFTDDVFLSVYSGDSDPVSVCRAFAAQYFPPHQRKKASDHDGADLFLLVPAAGIELAT